MQLTASGSGDAAVVGGADGSRGVAGVVMVPYGWGKGGSTKEAARLGIGVLHGGETIMDWILPVEQ